MDYKYKIILAFSFAILGLSIAQNSQAQVPVNSQPELEVQSVTPQGVQAQGIQIKKPSKALESAAETIRARAEADKKQQCALIVPKINDWWYPGFDWEMPARYGHDKKHYIGANGEVAGNGIIDLPNSSAYILNTESHSDDPNDACACPETSDAFCEPKFNVKFRLAGGRDASYSSSILSIQNERQKLGCPFIDFPEEPQKFHRWEVNKKPISSNANTPSVCLPEGRHEVTLRKNYGRKEKAVTRYIEVIDHLIVNLGDSYGSGEGVPEKVARPKLWENMRTNKTEPVNWSDYIFYKEFPFYSHWADTGQKIPMTEKLLKAYDRGAWNNNIKDGSVDFFLSKAETLSDMQLALSGLTPRYQTTVQVPDWDVIKDGRNGDYAKFVHHQNAHRSSAAAASQLALFLEKKDKKSSVTFVNLAASGATIENGVLGQYNGVKEFGSNLRIYPLRPQIAELKELTEGRAIDNIFLSVGGNDVGFANIIGVFLTAWADAFPLGGDIIEEDGKLKTRGALGEGLKSLRDGQWRSRDYGLFPKGNDWDADKIIDGIGLDGLFDGYQDIQDKLDRLNINAPVALVSYPNFGSARKVSDPKVPNTKAGTGIYYCDISFSAGPVNLDFDPIEFKVAEMRVLNPLSSIMKRAANKHKWSLIEQGLEPSRHGICGGSPYNKYAYDLQIPPNLLENNTTEGTRWYRTPHDGEALQKGSTTSNTGLFHPNEFGYRHVGQLMFENMEFYGAEFERLSTFTDSNDSISEATRIIDKPRAVFSGKLKGSQDVSMYKLATKNKRCRQYTVSVKSQNNTQPLTVSIFGRNGEVIASSFSKVKPTRLKPVKNDMQFLNRNESGLISTINSSSGMSRLPSRILPAVIEDKTDTFCSAESYENLGKSQQGQTSTVSFISEASPEVYIGISFNDNFRYDPVTGRGDSRRDLDRGETTFSLQITTK